MKHALTIIRFFVGGLFIFSGMIKVNDPVGTAIKMEEYFDIFSVDFATFFEIFVPLALPIAVFMVVLEVVLGVMLLLNYRQNLTLGLLLIILVFFTFLTGYSAFTGNVTDCGCFGDAIKLTPMESFIKDIVLMVLAFILYFGEHKPQSEKLEKISHFAVGGSLVLSLGMSIYAIMYLPFIDFRAYKIGNHIPTEMQPSAEYIYEYVMEKDGKEYTFDTYPTDKTYTFKAMNHLNPEAAPKITDFAIWNDTGDYTDEMLTGNRLFIIMYDIRKTKSENIKDVNTLIQALGGKLDVYALTASDGESYKQFAQSNRLSVPFYYTDATVLKTINRANPGLWLIKDGIVIGKWHGNAVPNYSEILDVLKM